MYFYFKKIIFTIFIIDETKYRFLKNFIKILSIPFVEYITKKKNTLEKIELYTE